MNRTRRIITLLCAGSCVGPGAVLGGVLFFAGGSARAELKPLAVGLFVPTLVGAGREERVTAVDQLATFLTKELGIPVSGRSFARAADLAIAAKRQLISLAIVTAPYAAEQGWLPLASLTQRGGAKATAWMLLGRPEYGKIGDLGGKIVAIPEMGRTDKNFVTNVLLEGEIGAQYFKWLAAPDAPSAIKAVQLKKADAAVVPEGDVPAGLKSLFVSRTVPLPVMVAIGSALEAKDQARVVEALRRWSSPWLGFSGWVPAEAGTYSSLRRGLFGGVARKVPAVAKPTDTGLGKESVFAARQGLTFRLPAPTAVVDAPSGKPDL